MTVGLPVAEWLRDRAEAEGGFDVDFAEIAEIALPFVDEPNHPRLRQYTRSGTARIGLRAPAASASSTARTSQRSLSGA